MDEKTYHHSSGLQVAPTHEDEVPKHLVYDGSDLPEHVPVAAKRTDVPRRYGAEDTNKEYIPDTQRRRCGLKRRTFLILLAVLLVLIIGGAVGGAVGGTQAKHKNQKVQVQPASGGAVPPASNSSATASPSSTASSATSTASSATPTSTSDAKYNFTVYSEPQYGGKSQFLSTVGSFDLPFGASSYVWLPGKSGCCVRFCHNGTDVGYRCDLVTYQTKSSSSFERAVVICSAGSPPDPTLCDPSASSQGG